MKTDRELIKRLADALHERDDTLEMDLKALDWWHKWKDFLFKAIEKAIGETK